MHRSIIALLRERHEERPPGLRFVRSIGAAMPAEMLAEIEATLGVPVLEGYGLTEAGAVTGSPFPPHPRKPGSAGRSTGAEFAILGERGDPLPSGAEGEICVRGACVIKGYLDDPEANRQAFSNGWLRTGDLGRVDSDGYLFVTGRIKEIINRGGEKILPNEIDRALAAHPAVSEAAAFGVPHPSLGEDVAAAVVLHAGVEASEAELRTWGASRLAAFKVPRRIFIKPEIPKSATGKPRRHLLFEHVRPTFVPPSTPMERKVTQIWSRILGSERIGIDDDFFIAGGDSLAATVMILEVERETGASADVNAFFADPTIRALAHTLAGAAGTTDHALLTLRPHGSMTPFFCIAGASEDSIGLRHLAESLGEDRPFHALRDPRAANIRGVYTVEDVVDLLLSSIRAVQPCGPYLLGGHCYGGILSFEMVRRLAESGKPAPLVILMDTPTPGFPKLVPEIVRHRKAYWNEMLRALRGERHAAREITGHATKLVELLKRRTARSIDRALIRAGVSKPVPASQDPTAGNGRAARNYMPVPFSGKVVQFMTTEGLVDREIWEDSRLAWREFAQGGFSVISSQAPTNPCCFRQMFGSSAGDCGQCSMKRIGCILA